jgi:hypothetical protein
MTYSMAGASALGYDLARMPQGEHVATVVRTALHCTSRHLRRLSTHHPGDARRRELWAALEEEGTPESMTTAVGVAETAAALALRGEDDASARLLQRLELATLGSLESLDRFLRRDVLDWTWSRHGGKDVQDLHAHRAADVLVDAAASAFGTVASPRERRRMATPFLVTGLSLVDGVSVTGHPGVDELLTTLTRTDATTRDSWRAAVDELRPRTTDWAPAMHQATWALHLSGRLRLSMDAQMAALTAFRAAGFTAQDAAYGVWNAVSGAVAATCVADLLPDADQEVLLRAWGAVHTRG